MMTAAGATEPQAQLDFAVQHLFKTWGLRVAKVMDGLTLARLRVGRLGAPQPCPAAPSPTKLVTALLVARRPWRTGSTLRTASTCTSAWRSAAGRRCGWRAGWAGGGQRRPGGGTSVCLRLLPVPSPQAACAAILHTFLQRLRANGAVTWHAKVRAWRRLSCGALAQLLQ